MTKYHNDKLDKIYKKLPKLNCKGLCQQSCSLIKVGELERKRVAQHLGSDPFIPSENFLEVLAASPFDQWKCSLLKDGKCSIYRIRPLICRLFGLVEKMKCPFGCVPDRWLTDSEAKKMMEKAQYYARQQE